MSKHLFGINFLAFFVRGLIVLLFSLGALLIAMGILFFLFPRYSFHTLIIPLANIFSQTGHLREMSTVEFLYREWTSFGIYMIIALGLMLISFASVWYCLEKEGKKEVSLIESTIDKTQQGNSYIYTITLITIIIVGIILRIINLNQSLWGDEIGTVTQFIKPFKFWRYLELGDHWLYSFLGFLSIKLFGESEVVIRLPAFTLGIAAIPVMYYVVKDFFSQEEGLLASGLLCVSVFHIRYSNDARGYSTLALLALVSSFLFLRIILNRNPVKRQKECLLFGVFTTLGLLTHFYYIWVLLAQYLTILTIFLVERLTRKKAIGLRGYGSGLLTVMVTAVLTACIIYGPSFIPAVIKKYLFWKGIGEPISLKFVGHFFVGAATTNLWGFIFTALVLYSLVDLWRKQNKILAIYLIFLVGLPLVIVRIICKASQINYFIYALPFLLIALAHSMVIFARRFSTFFRYIILSALVITFISIQLPALLFYYQHYKAGAEDYRAVGQLIDKLAKKEDIICSIGIGNEHPQYYIKKHEVRYLNELEFSRQVELGKSRIWLVVTYPDFLHLYQESRSIYELARKRLKLVGYFPGAFSDLLVYVNR